MASKPEVQQRLCATIWSVTDGNPVPRIMSDGVRGRLKLVICIANAIQVSDWQEVYGHATPHECIQV